MGDLRDRAMALAALVEAFAVKDMTPVRVRAYEDGLKDVPVPLLNAAVRLAIETRAFFPKVAELKRDAETCRQQLVAAHPYAGCIDCEDSKGWIDVQMADGVRAKRCPCFQRHQAKLASLGVTSTPLALPEPEREFRQIAE